MNTWYVNYLNIMAISTKPEKASFTLVTGLVEAPVQGARLLRKRHILYKLQPLAEILVKNCGN